MSSFQKSRTLINSCRFAGRTPLFTSAVDIVNALAAAQATGGIKREMARLLKPSLLVVDLCAALSYVELGEKARGNRAVLTPHN